MLHPSPLAKCGEPSDCGKTLTPQISTVKLYKMIKGREKLTLCDSVIQEVEDIPDEGKGCEREVKL